MSYKDFTIPQIDGFIPWQIGLSMDNQTDWRHVIIYSCGLRNSNTAFIQAYNTSGNDLLVSPLINIIYISNNRSE